MVTAILVVALAARLGLALLYEPPAIQGDAAVIGQHAAAIVDHGGYPQSTATVEGGPTAFRPPAYPYVLAAVFKVVGRGVDTVRVFGALLGVVAVALLGAVAAQLFGRRAALVAMAIAAVFPPLVMISVAQLSEGLFIVFVLGALAAVLRGPDRLRWVAAAGALVAAAALTRTNGIVLLLPLLLAARGARPRLALLAVAVVVITPWSIRSSTELDAFVPLSTQTGLTLAGVYNDASRTDPRHPAAWRIPTMQPYRDLRRPGVNEAQLESAFREKALDYAAEHPSYPFVVVWWMSLRMLNVADFDLSVANSYEAGVRPRYSRLNRYTFWLVALLALAGAATAAARAAPRWLWLFPLALWFSVALTSGTTRYRTPVDPFLVLLAAVALVRPAPAARASARPPSARPPRGCC